MVKGWSRDKDDNITCQEGYRKKQKTHQEDPEGMEVKAGSVRADPFFNQDL